MFDGVVSRASSSAVIYDDGVASWRPRVARNGLCPLLKRAFDLVVASLALLILLPAYGVIAGLIAVDSPGPILFRQRRTGKDGRVFVIFKFRTMRMASDDTSVRHASRNDDRVTRLGRTLRETSLDEIPQLLNVIRGDMTLVGPRPHAVEHDILYGSLIPHYAERFAVRPGLTGLAQVQGLRGEIRELACMARRVDADVLYARHWSFPGDLGIIVRTIPLLLAKVNAY